MGKSKKNSSNTQSKSGKRQFTITAPQREAAKSMAEFYAECADQKRGLHSIQRNLLDLHRELVTRCPDSPALQLYADTVGQTKVGQGIAHVLFTATMFPETHLSSLLCWDMLTSATEVLVANEFKKNEWDRFDPIIRKAIELTNGSHFPPLSMNYVQRNELFDDVTMNDIATMLMVAYLPDHIEEIVKQNPHSNDFDYSGLNIGEMKAILAPLMDRKLMRECILEALDFSAKFLGKTLENIAPALQGYLDIANLPPQTPAFPGMIDIAQYAMLSTSSSAYCKEYIRMISETSKQYYGSVEEIEELFEGKTYDFRRIVAGFFFLDMDNPCAKNSITTATAAQIAAGFLPEYTWRYWVDKNGEQFGPSSAEELEDYPVDPAQKEICTKILDILYKPHELRSIEKVGHQGTQTNAQLLNFAGMNILCPEKTLPDREKFEKFLDSQVRLFKFNSEAELGAIAMLLALTEGRVFDVQEKTYEIQAAAFAEQNLALLDQIKSLQSETSRLQTELKRNSTNKSDADRLLHEKDELIAKLQRQLEGEQQEKEEIRTQMDTLLSSLEETPEEETEEEIQYPIDISDKNVYLFGGFPAFHRNVLENLPGIHISSVDRKINESTIHNASLVVLQINHMSHPTFYKLSSACDAAKIPWIALRSGGVDQSCKQILGAIERLGI